jgi:hypothetical protein
MGATQLIQPLVSLEPISHRYFDPEGCEYKSVSKLLESFKEKFDEEKMSWLSAGKQLKAELGRAPSAQEQQLRQQALKVQWKQKNRASLDIGTEIHNAIEDFLKTGRDNPLFPFVREMARKYFSDYKEVAPETALYSKKYFLAGTSDLPAIRGSKVIDILDFKTNASKGILYNNPYGKRMLGCLNHLEECSYNTYCLQLSVYAYMLEEHGWKIGRLGLIYIPPSEPDKHFMIPVPYMKADVVNMLDYAAHYGVIKKQPEMISI